MRRGFKSEAEQIAEELRAELGLRNIDRLQPVVLLRHLEIPSVSLSRLADGATDPDLRRAAAFLQSEQASSLSAMTVFRGRRRLIVFNDSNDPGRQSSDLCHEAGHAILLHQPAQALDLTGCRIWEEAIEKEADYLAGVLLIPGKGARYAAKCKWSLQRTADHFGCSVDMARWRDNESGGLRLRRR